MNFSRRLTFAAAILIWCFSFGVFPVFAQTPAPTPPVAGSEDSSAVKKSGVLEIKRGSNSVNAGISPNGLISDSIDTKRIGIDSSQTLPLSLDEAIRKALENNNDIEVARADVRFQETQLRSLLGTYDPVFSVSPTYSRNSSTGSSATNDFRLNAGFDKFFERGGGSINTFFNNNRLGRNSPNNPTINQTSALGASSSTTYSSNLGINYTQPLFRNFRIDNTRRQIKIQRKRLQQSDADFAGRAKKKPDSNRNFVPARLCQSSGVENRHRIAEVAYAEFLSGGACCQSENCGEAAACS